MGRGWTRATVAARDDSPLTDVAAERFGDETEWCMFAASTAGVDTGTVEPGGVDPGGVDPGGAVGGAEEGGVVFRGTVGVDVEATGAETLAAASDGAGAGMGAGANGAGIGAGANGAGVWAGGVFREDDAEP